MSVSIDNSSNISLGYTLPAQPSNLLGDTPFSAVQNKSFVMSSPTTISSVSGATMTTSRSHGLLVGDQILFPVIGSLSGIVANTIYTLSAAPTSTTFTLSGITFGGTVGTAYYIIISRAVPNQTSPGGLVQFADPNNSSWPLQFDTSSSLGPTILRFPSVAAGAQITFPSGNGTLITSNTTTTISATYTFSGGIASTRAGNTSAASSNLYINPASTAMSGSSSYFYSYFNTPPSTGSSTGTSSTLVIAGATTTAANNFALQVLAGQNSFPSATVSAPAICFGTNRTSGIYSSAANVINLAASGANVLQISSAGATISGACNATTLIAGAGALNTPSLYLGADTTTGFYRSAANTWDWIIGSLAYLRVSSAGITVPNATCNGKTTTSQLQVGANGSTYSQISFGNFTLTAPNIAPGFSSSTVITHNLGSVPSVLCNISSTSALNTALNFLVCSAFNVTSTQATIIVTNVNTTATTAGNVSVSWKAYV